VIVSHDIKSVYVHSEKTGGTTITLILAEHAGAKIQRGHGWQSRHHQGPMHSPIPQGRLEEFADYLKWGFVRNPYDRWRSWWQILGRDTKREMIPMHSILRGVDRVGRFEHFERDLRDILAGLGVEVPTLPHCNPSVQHRALTAADADWIWNRDRRDFEQFGYDQESWREYA